MAYYSYTGVKIAKDICQSCHPKAQAILMVAGGITGHIIGAIKGKKSDICRKCKDANYAPTAECKNPTSLRITPVSCTEYEFKFDGHQNLPTPQNFDWINHNLNPAEARTISPELRALVTTSTAVAKAECTYESCNEENDFERNTFIAKDDFWDMNDRFSVGANSSTVAIGDKVTIWVSTGKVWYPVLYDISYAVISGHAEIQNWSVDPNSIFAKDIKALPGSGTITIRVTITEKCTGQATSKDIPISIN